MSDSKTAAVRHTGVDVCVAKVAQRAAQHAVRVLKRVSSSRMARWSSFQMPSHPFKGRRWINFFVSCYLLCSFFFFFWLLLNWLQKMINWRRCYACFVRKGKIEKSTSDWHQRNLHLSSDPCPSACSTANDFQKYLLSFLLLLCCSLKPLPTHIHTPPPFRNMKRSSEIGIIVVWSFMNSNKGRRGSIVDRKSCAAGDLPLVAGMRSKQSQRL